MEPLLETKCSIERMGGEFVKNFALALVLVVVGDMNKIVAVALHLLEPFKCPELVLIQEKMVIKAEM